MTTDISKLFNRMYNQFGEIVKMEKVLGLKTGVQLYDPSDIEKVIIHFIQKSCHV